MFKHILVTAIFLATFANASLIGSTAVFRRRLLNDLQNTVLRRQTTGSGNSTIPLSAFPPECQSGCTVAVNAINTCANATCLCTKAVDSSLQGCLDCVLQSSEAANLGASAGQVVTLYNQECSGSGIPSISLASGVTASGTATTTGTEVYPSSGSSSAAGGTTAPTLTSTPTATVATTGSSAPTSTKTSGASATSASVGLLTIVVTFLAAFMA